MLTRVFSQGARLDVALIFFGMSLFVSAVTPDIPFAKADGMCGTCPDGMVCVAIGGEGYECQCPISSGEESDESE